MPAQLGATFVPGSDDDYFMPEVVAPAPQRVTPQVPQNMQEDLQRMELEAREIDPRGPRETLPPQGREREPSLSTYIGQKPERPPKTLEPVSSSADINTHQQGNESLAPRIDTMDYDAPSFSPFPKVTGDNIPPADDEKEKILWQARSHVLYTQNVSMQITWARDVLNWAEISMEAAAREAIEKGTRPSTPRREHELRNDAINIIKYLSEQEHPDALYIRAKWLEFGKFGERIDKREAYTGYKRAAEFGHARSEYRMGMLFEQSNDMSKAKEHYYKGLSSKDSAALYRMGMMSLLGQHGESKDYHGGLERIRAAADSADEDAPQGAYVYGMLIGRDLPDIAIPEGLLPYAVETAKMYIEKAAYLGFAKAQLKMGQAYELCQLGCDFNPSYSLHYYGLAAKQGLPEAALGVSRWFLFGYEGVFKKNEELAFKYANEAACAKLPTGEFAMGYYHEIGIHVNKNIAEARRWYQLAAEHGNKDAVGRLESLNQDKSLSKQDHETTTLTRIKSQHGSQRGKRPERFKQPQQMPTVSEGSGSTTPVNEGGPAVLPTLVTSVGSPRVSPLPSPGMRPNIVTEHTSFPDPSRASIVGGSDRPPAFNIRLDSGSQPVRSQSTAPYPVDDRPQPLAVRPKSTAPYPEDDTRPGSSRYNNNLPLAQGPQADRPMSAFGIKPQGNAGGPRPMPGSQSTGNLYHASQPPPGGAGRGRNASAGWDPQGPGGYRQTSPGHPGDQRPGSAQPYPNNNADRSRLQKQQPGRPPYSGGLPGGPHGVMPPAGQDAGHYGPRTSSRPVQDASSYPELRQDPRFPRTTGGPGDHSYPERVGSLPLQEPRQSRMPASGQASPGPQGMHGSGGASRPGRPEMHSSSPAPSAASAPPKPPPGKGPATFEDMGIPQGKQDGDCVLM